MPVYDDPADGRLIPADALAAWTAGVVERMGTPPDIALEVAEILVAADRRGIASHGTARLPRYVELIDAGALDPEARPELVRTLPATLLLLFDAHDGWGQHAARVAVDAAIEAARSAGACTAVVRESHHFGIAGWYSLRVADAGFIGVSLTNTSPLVAPTRGVDALLGTNPIAVAAPAGPGRLHLCLDMATSTVPRGRLEVAARRGESLHPSWAIDAEGRPTRSPEAALGGSLMPLGGTEEAGGYKGYGLTLVVDILTGVLGGGAPGPLIAPVARPSAGRPNVVHTFMVVDPDAFDGPGTFVERMDRELGIIEAARTAPDAPGPVLVPGEPEVAAERRSAARGVAVDPAHLASLERLATRFGLALPASLPLAPLVGSPA
jgi:LDH2 family malate/lactate/ureidoglycolate dehydrogenase